MNGLRAALTPESIAIIGASDNPHKVGGRPLMYLTRFGYRGRLYPINPSRRVVQGVPAFASLDALPEAPELAIIAVPGDRARQAVDACADRGVKVAVVMASGFGETHNLTDIAAQDAMLARARAAGMRLVGPNCQGLANLATGMIASFSTMFLEVEPALGPAAIISQSGVMSVAPYGLLRERGIGVRQSHATGNEADVTLSELAVEVVQDPEVRLLLLYIESIRDPPVLARAAALARDRDLPVVAIKSGRTARGQAAARSHTGALASDDRIVEAFLRHHGIWRVDDVHGLVNAAELYLKGWRPRGRSLVVVTTSGASGVMAADAAEALGLPLSPLSESAQHRLRTKLPDFASVTNPIDVTAALLGDSRLLGTLLPALVGEQADLFLVAVPVAGEGYDLDVIAGDTAAFAAEAGRPVVAAAPQARVAEAFRRVGIPAFANQTDAMNALAQVSGHAALLRRRRVEARPASVAPLPAGATRFLNEFDSLRYLAAQGLPVVPHRVCHSEDEARAAFRALGGPVVVKGCSVDLPHKPADLVALDVATEDEAARLFHAHWRRLEALGVRRDGVIVARMTRGRELLLGAMVDARFGPVVMIGDGGRYAEWLDDIAIVLPPFDEADVRDALAGLRIAPLLAGVRGEPALDVEAVCAAAVRLGNVVSHPGSAIQSVDCNPIVVGTAGAGVTIVDALIERSGSQEARRVGENHAPDLLIS